MGFLDKVKEQAAVAGAVAKDAAQKGSAAAKEAAQKGQAKLNEVQAKKAADELLRDLGAAAYAEQTGRGSGATGNDIERLVAALHAHEEAHGPISLTLESDAGVSDGPLAGGG